MNNTIIIECPWTKYPANGIYLSSDQVKVVYDLIVTAFLYKCKYEQSQNKSADVKFNLNEIRVYNKFVNESFDKILDPVARDYVLKTIAVIKENNYNKKNIKISYSTLYRLLNPESSSGKNIRKVLAESHQMIDFYRLFNICSKTALSTISPEISEIEVTWRTIIDMNKIENNLF